MSIDFNNETVGGLSDVAALLPRLHGKRLHSSTLWRWTTKGVRGVRLEYIGLGGRLLTSVEAVVRFAAKLAELDQQPANDDPPEEVRQKAKRRTPTQRDRDVARARKELEAAGIR